MSLLSTLLAFLVVIGTLAIVHELGHYLVARWCGVKVLRFSVGMGKIVFSRRLGRDQTEWAISILPFGGYVKMLDAREQDLTGLSAADLKREFTSQTVWRRIAIVAAGPLANFLLAIALLTGLYMHGIPEPIPKLRAVPTGTAAYAAGLRGGETVTAVNGEPIRIWSELRWKLMQLAIEKAPARLDLQQPGRTPESVILRTDGLAPRELEGDFLVTLGIDLARPRAVLGTVHPGGPAMAAGLRTGDVILEVNGTTVRDALAFIELVRASPGKPLHISGLRGQQPFSVDATPAAVASNGQTVGRLSVEVPAAPEMINASDPPLKAVGRAVKRSWDTSALTVKMLGKMIVGEISWKNITGPITIADYAGQTARSGGISFLSFVAFISISLGVMNLLPIPVLDGGLLLYYSLEVFTGRPISERFGEIAQRAGIGLLMMLMVVAVFNDVVRLLS